ncbi:MAG: TRAP transporter small permease subunit [Rhizobiaceae bacterium]
MALATAYEVVARYFFRQPTIWATELTALICGFVFLCSGMYAMRNNEHLSITIFYDTVPVRVRIALDTIKLVVILGFCFGLSVVGFNSGWEPLIRWERAGTHWNPPTPALLKPMVVVVAFVMAAQAVINYARAVRRLSMSR